MLTADPNSDLSAGIFYCYKEGYIVCRTTSIPVYSRNTSPAVVWATSFERITTFDDPAIQSSASTRHLEVLNYLDRRISRTLDVAIGKDTSEI